MSMNNQEECSFSGMELFKDPVVQSDILNGKFEKTYPIAKLEDSGPIEFLIKNATDHFLDLRQSYLSIKFKVTNSDGSNLAADAKAGLGNYPIDLLFQQVDVLLNGNLLSSSANTYVYRAMLEVLLEYDHRAKSSYLTIGLYSKDTASKMDMLTVDDGSDGLKARTKYFKQSKIVEVSGLLHCNLIHSDRLLLNSLPLKIVLHRQRDSFVSIADDASRDCRVCIIDMLNCLMKNTEIFNNPFQLHQLDTQSNAWL